MATFITDLVKTMSNLQDDTNSKLNKNWRKQGWNFKLAVKVEAGELADHIGYKWWKAVTPPDLNQMHLELVDIWHFLLSEAIATDFSLSMDEWEEIEPAQEPKRMLDNNEAFKLIEELMAQDELYPLLTVFFRLCTACGLTFDRLYKLYIGKAALNRFRWDKGYGTTYEKHWAGEEDNVHLMTVLRPLSLLETTVEKVYSELDELYKYYVG